MARKWEVVKGEIVPRRSLFRLCPLRQERIAADHAVRDAADVSHIQTTAVRIARGEAENLSVVEAFLSLPFRRHGRRNGTKFGRHPKRLF